MNWSKKHLKHRFYRANFYFPHMYKSYKEYATLYNSAMRDIKYYGGKK